jgi:diguanylate cyclase (GGDEF)-like protein/PAS domain S-box-containing protein
MYWLVLVQLVAVVPLMAFSMLLVLRLVSHSTEDAQSLLEQKARVAADAVAREADRVTTRLQLLVSQPSALSGDIAAVRRLADRLVETDSSIAGASALDRSGQLVFTTHRPEGTPLPRLPLPVGAAMVFSTGQTYVSGLAAGGLNDVTLIGFAAPWRVDGEIRYALRMSLKPSALGDVLRQQRWPEAWTAALIDQDMRIVARSREESRHFGQPASDSLQAFIRSRHAGIGRSVTRDGVDVVTVVVPVSGTPWSVVAGLPYAELRQQATAPIAWLLAGGISTVAAGAFLSLRLSRRLNRDLQEAADGHAGAGTTITELRGIELQRLVLDNELVGMVRLKERRSVWHNRALEIIFGYEPGELEGHSPRLMHPDEESFLEFGRIAYPHLRAGKPYRTQVEMRRKDGSAVWVDVSGIEIAHGETLWMILDVSAMKQEHDRVRGLALHDALTGLANRTLLVQELSAALAIARRDGSSVVIAFLDLNGFKAVNDDHGHDIGDELLRVVAGRLNNCIRPHDAIARLGGDEFVILLTRLTDPQMSLSILARMRESVAEPIHIDGHECGVTVAMGTATFPDEGVDGADELLRAADRRMYVDKRRSKESTARTGC